MLGAVERCRQIGEAPMPVPGTAFQRPISGVVAGDREAVLRSRACHLAGPCLLPAGENTATGMKFRRHSRAKRVSRLLITTLNGMYFDQITGVSDRLLPE